MTIDQPKVFRTTGYPIRYYGLSPARSNALRNVDSEV
jgi:hypothetical protein